jgi:hypothetical protein
MSRPITIDIPHRLGAAEARKRIETGFVQIQQQIPGGLAQLDQRWDGERMSFSGKVAGQAIAGRLDVLEEAVKMEIDLPPMLAMLADAIKGKVRKQGTLLLEKK